MAGAVKSVEIFQMSIVDSDGLNTTTPVTDTLNLGQDIDFCVPFITKRAITDNGSYEIECTQVDAWFASPGSVDTLYVARDSDVGSLEVEVAVVEFDSARCKVQSGTWTVAGGAGNLSGTATLNPTVDLANSFLVFHSYQNSDSGNHYNSHLWRGQINAINQVTFDRGPPDSASLGTADGHWYVVESNSGTDFTVETSDIQIAAAASNNTDTVDVTAATTMLLGSWKVSNPDSQTANDDCTVDANLNAAGDTITVSRAQTVGVIDWHGQLVKFTDNTAVQRATLEQRASTASENLALATEVADDRSMAVVAGNMGSTVAGSFPGNQADEVWAAQVQLTLVDVAASAGKFDEVQFRHATDGGQASQDISYEVIEFGTGGSPPATRRVMVIS